MPLSLINIATTPTLPTCNTTTGAGGVLHPVPICDARIIASCEGSSRDTKEYLVKKGYSKTRPGSMKRLLGSCEFSLHVKVGPHTAPFSKPIVILQ